jgi:kumamolisin
MKRQIHKTPIRGSYRTEVPGARLLAPSDDNEKIAISIYARRNPNPPVELIEKVSKLSAQLPSRRNYLNQKEFERIYGADPVDLQKIKAWAKTNNLQFVREKLAQRKIELRGKIGDISRALDVQFNEYDHPSLGRFRGRSGNIFVSEDVCYIIDGIFGLDTRPIGSPRYRKANTRPLPISLFKQKRTGRASMASLSNTFPGTFFPPEIAVLYNYPKGTDGSGQNIAVFAFNGPDKNAPGGYNLAALQEYFQNVLGQSAPDIQDVVIQGMGNVPGQERSDADSTDEVMLDICTVGGVAPGAKIFMYFTEFTSKGWIDAIHDAIAGKNNIAVISISYGNPEQDKNSLWSAMEVKIVNEAFEAAASRGITICCAAGDDGSSDEGSGPAEVDFPASSPNTLGVGGTKLISSGGPNPQIVSETVWNEVMIKNGATGGGVSVIFSKPSYQDNVQIPVSVTPPHQIGRGVPDVSAVGDPQTGLVVIHIDGKKLDPIGGTSASTPLWAGLIARLNEGLKARCGFLNPLLYTRFSSGVLRDITQGNNGAYAAGPGWDACTGLGSPDGEKLLNALSGESG